MALVASVSALLAACSGSEKSGEARAAAVESTSTAGSASAAATSEREVELKLTADETQRAGIALETLTPQAQSDVVTVTATIGANQDRFARVAPRVEGRIVSTTAKLGDRVTAGQVLATLDSVALGEAEASLREAQSAQRVAQADFQRAESLSAEEIIPRRDYLRAKGDYETATSRLEAARDKLRLLGATSSGSGGGPTFQLQAPIAGTVVQKDSTLGELASPASPVFTVADLSHVWIEADLTEDVLARVSVGAPAAISVTAYPGDRFSGKVTYIAGIVDKETRVVPARVEVDNADGRLKPGMFATAVIETGRVGVPALSVPDAAIVLLQGQPIVFVAEQGGYEPHPIEPGAKLGGRTVVKSGLKAGDRIVAAGTYALKARLLRSQISEE